MALFGRDYDRDYGYYGANRGYDTGYRGGNYGNFGARETYGAYDRDYGMRGGGYSRYDEGYKSRWQTDYGDPFGDRTARTPMRMIRGEFHGGRGREFNDAGYDRNYMSAGYDRDYYAANPATYDPYMNRNYGGRNPEGRMGNWNRNESSRFGGGYNRGYDRGWF